MTDISEFLNIGHLYPLQALWKHKIQDISIVYDHKSKVMLIIAVNSLTCLIIMLWHFVVMEMKEVLIFSLFITAWVMGYVVLFKYAVN